MAENQLTVINSLAETEITSELVASQDFNLKYKLLLDTMAKLEEIKTEVNKRIQEVLRDQYLSSGEQSVASENYTYTYVPGSMRETFDTKSFKVDQPELYKKYVKTSEVKESLRVNKK